MQSDCEINWVLFSLLFSFKSGFSLYPMKQTIFLHLLLHHFLQSKIWIQKVSGDAWSFLHIFCWNKWNIYLSLTISLKTFEILYRSLATCIKSHRGRGNGGGTNGKMSFWEFSSQLQGRENDVAFPVTRGTMWGKCNIYLRGDQCCHKTKQQQIKHSLGECFHLPLRRGCHPLAGGVSLSQVFSILQLSRVLSAGSSSGSSSSAGAAAHLLAPLLREPIQAGIGQIRKDGVHSAGGIHSADVIPSFAHLGSLVQKGATAMREEKREWSRLDLGSAKLTHNFTLQLQNIQGEKKNNKVSPSFESYVHILCLEYCLKCLLSY